MRKVLIGLAVAAVLAIAVPFLVPMSSYIPRVAALASEKLGVPVQIGDLELRLLPTPRLVASDLAVGKKKEIRVGTLEIVPELWSLVSGPPTLRLVRAQKVDLDEPALTAMFARAGGGGGDSVEVRRVELKEARLLRSSVRLPPGDLRIDLGAGYRMEHARLELPDVAIDVAVSPESPKAALFNTSGTLYGGKVAAATRADWTKQWQISGTLSADDVDLAPLERLLGKPVRLTGRLDAQMTYSSKARSADRLLDAAIIDGPFQVNGGAYHGIDLAKAGDLTATRAAEDATRFDEFKGQLEVRGRQVAIKDLCVRSPALVAGGNVQIAEDQKLSGKLSVSVAKTGGFVGVPVSLSGTTADPSVKPTSGYTIGAVVGTLILPGIGTGIGASAASAIEGSSACK